MKENNKPIASMYELKTIKPIKLLIVWNNWDRLVKPTLAPLLAKSHYSNLRSGLASSLSTSSFPLLLYDLISSIFLPSFRLNIQPFWKNFIKTSFRPNGNQNVTSACAQFTTDRQIYTIVLLFSVVSSNFLLDVPFSKYI